MTASRAFTAIVALFVLGGAIDAGVGVLNVLGLAALALLVVWFGLSMWIAHLDARDQNLHDAIVRRHGREIRSRS